jgi:nicotinamidase/pyrazinamidase
MTETLVFIDVDTQHDFMDPTGRLYVPGAEQLLPNLGRLLDHARTRKIPVISTMDTHAPDDPEFKEFPPHCVAGSPGHKKVPRTTVPGAVKVTDNISQETGQGAWILEKHGLDAFSNPNLVPLLRRLGARRAVVFGVATDYCVKLAVFGLLKEGIAVTVASDAIAGVSRDAAERALAEMRDAGAQFASTQEILASS